MARHTTPTTGDRKPHAVDLHVGRRLRMRRALVGVSQEKLAEAVGITFQQVQKYERGQSRVSAGRLYQFGLVLGVAPSYFFEDYDSKDIKPISSAKKAAAPRLSLSDNDQENFISEDQLYSRDTMELVRLFHSIQDEKKRKEMLRIFRSMIESLNN